jgi:hypothetical protein
MWEPTAKKAPPAAPTVRYIGLGEANFTTGNGSSPAGSHPLARRDDQSIQQVIRGVDKLSLVAATEVA